MKFILVLIFASCACGRMIPRFGLNNGRIVGGNTASTGQFPYQVALKYNNVQYCGGSIISQGTILTAAHCANGLQTSPMTVYVGSTQLDGDGVHHTVSSFLVHENWNAPLATNDIALIFVQNSISYTTNVQSIPVDSAFIATNTSCVVSGWGALNFPEELQTNDLQYFNGTIFDLEQCKQIYQGGIYPVLDTNICVYSRAGQGSCRGDSGGPSAANGRQVGIASWFAMCALGVPDVFTRVSSYSDWIQTNTIN